MGKDAAFQILLERLAHRGLGAAVVALAVELAGAGPLQPGLVMFGYRLVQPRALGVARVVEFGSGCCAYLGRDGRSVARRGMRMGSAVWPGCASVHGAAPLSAELAA